MGAYISRGTTTTNAQAANGTVYGDDVTDSPVISNARVVEHVVARYDDVDNPETHMPYAKVPTEFCLKPKYEQGKLVCNSYS